MDNPGVTSPLFAAAITTALTAQAQTPIENLDGMSALNLVAELLGATGGTSIEALVQTSFVDDDSMWLDVARFDFTTTAAKNSRCSRRHLRRASPATPRSVRKG